MQGLNDNNDGGELTPQVGESKDGGLTPQGTVNQESERKIGGLTPQGTGRQESERKIGGLTPQGTGMQAFRWGIYPTWSEESIGS